MSKLRVRVYNVLFGDAILISVPEKGRGGREVTRHILIDVGNVLSGPGGGDDVFEAILRDVRKTLGRRHLDLYVMTHEHMDHVQGLLHGSSKLKLDIPVKYAWLTASAAENYYETHPEAKKRRLQALDAYDGIERFLSVSPKLAEKPFLNALLLNNNPRSTADCVEHLRGLAAVNTTYVHRGCDLSGAHNFTEAAFEIWGPEEDTTDYYGRFQPMSLGVSAGEGPRAKPALTRMIPPPGVDAGAFYNLVESRRAGYADNLLNIDQANNNTSIIFCLNWRGWRLLFTGDAEQRSWKTVWKRVKNRETPFEGGSPPPVHFLKISHHGSKNGMPTAEILDSILPKAAPDERPRYAAISTCPDCYNDVPNEDTLEGLRERCEVRSVLELTEGKFYFDIEFDG